MILKILLLACLGLCGPAQLLAQTPSPPEEPHVHVEFRYLRPPQKSSWPKGLDRTKAPAPAHPARPRLRKKPVAPVSPPPAPPSVAAPAVAAAPVVPAVAAPTATNHWWYSQRYTISALLLIVVAALWLWWFTRRRRDAQLKLEMQCWANTCYQAFNRHFQHLPSKRRFLLRRKIKCYPARGRFDLWLRNIAFNYPQNPSENSSVRQTLEAFAQDHPNPQFQPGAWTYRRGWVVIPFYQVPHQEA